MTGFASKRQSAWDKFAKPWNGIAGWKEIGKNMKTDENDEFARIEMEQRMRKTLAQPVQEPVTWRNAAIRLGKELSSVGPDGYYDMTAEQWLDWAMEQEPRGKNSLEQPAQEPAAVKHMLQWVEGLKRLSNHGQHLKIPGLGSGACWELANELEQFIKTSPPQRPWVGLTEDEMSDAIYVNATPMERGRRVEAAVKEKNT